MRHRVDGWLSKAIDRLVTAAAGSNQGMPAPADKATVFVVRHAKQHPRFPAQHADDWATLRTGVQMGWIQFEQPTEHNEVLDIMEALRFSSPLHGSEAIQ